VKKVGVIDYGTGNLRSVVKAFEFIGADVTLVKEISDAEKIDALVFPGQGTFDQCIGSLTQTGLDALIKNWIESDKPYFGICLGLQVLFSSSEEGCKQGLDLIEGTVKRFDLDSNYKIPHMGWNSVYWDTDRKDNLFDGITAGDQFYFVHSYCINQVESGLHTYLTSYGHEFISGIRFGNCVATQFHPEKSQEKGLKLYRNFLEKLV
jgi:glutamine amidotransferase